MACVTHVFYKKIEVTNAQYLNHKGPVIYALNHPNAFADPISFSIIAYPPKLHYLARGDVFKNKIFAKILKSLAIIPIYRIQDAGKAGVLKNEETNKTIIALLRKNKKIIMFVEGLCVLERRLRPLKKGLPRVAFKSIIEHPETENLLVIPVGVNYYNPTQFRGSVLFNVGQPILVKNYLDYYRESESKTTTLFLKDLTESLKPLIINIDKNENEQMVEQIEKLHFNQFNSNLNLSLKQQFDFSTSLVNSIETVEQTNPEKIQYLKKQLYIYFNNLSQAKKQDLAFTPFKINKMALLKLILNSCMILITFPIKLIGFWLNALPGYFTLFIVKQKVKGIEFIASFLLGIGAVLYCIYYLLLLFIYRFVFNSLELSVLFTICTPLLGWVHLWHNELFTKTKNTLHQLAVTNTKNIELTVLQTQRQMLIKLINNTLQL